jgi:gliding motility-associated protein GldM
MGATNCPETPRQRMISMMYLVLTALLALNVSQEVVQAFVLVEKGLHRTQENIMEKNNSIYADFQTAEVANPTKVQPWRMKADEVKGKSKELRDLIQQLKIEVIIECDGEDAPAVKGTTIYTDSIKKTQNLEAGGIVMIGPEGNGKAKDLKRKIEEYRTFLLERVDQSQHGLISSIKNSLDTSDPDGRSVEKKTWETVRFDQLPMIAVITMLTKMQTDISNTETDVINYLFDQIGILDVRVNKIDAIVKPKSNYIFTGGKYEAEVFLAAFDTTEQPVIYVGKVDSQEVSPGVYDYFMAGELGRNYDTLHVENGRGVYTTSNSTVNPNVRWGGLIEIKAPGGSLNRYPFKAEYQVAEAGLVVSPTKMNVFYIGVDNPVDISVPGIPKENLQATMTNGSIVKDSKSTGWVVRPDQQDGNGSKTAVAVTADFGGQKKEMGRVTFRVKRVPDPVAKIAQSKGGSITVARLTAENGVFAEIENFDFEMRFRVTSFTVSTLERGIYEIVNDSKDNRFSGEQLGQMRKLRRGDKVTFENIKAKGDDGTTRDLPPIIFRIN